MTNLDMFIQYGTKMVQLANKVAVVGLVGSNLTRKEIKVGIRKIVKRSKINPYTTAITLTDAAVIFTLSEEAA